MNDQESVGDALNSCPYLGLASDPSLNCSFLTSSHRCFRWPTPQPVDYQQQRNYCLSDVFEECDWFVSTLEAPPERRRSSSWVGYAGLLGVVAAAALVVGVLVYFRPWAFLLPGTSGPDRAALVEDVPTSAPSPVATATMATEPTSQPAALTVSPTLQPSPTADRQRTPTAAPAVAASTPRATATPAPRPPTATPPRPATTPAATPSSAPGSTAVRVYTVKEGDNLYSLARTFGVTMQDLMKANNLQETSILKVGQSLVVPTTGR